MKLLKNLKLLIVDDEKDTLEFYKATLENFFAQVFVAENGIDALDIFSKTPPDILFVDYEMPKLNGYELIQKIRLQNKDIPITIISGYENPKIMQKCIPLNISGYLFKPLKYSELVEHLNYLEKQYSNTNLAKHTVHKDVSVCFSTMEVFSFDKVHALSQLECNFLKILVENRGSVVSFNSFYSLLDDKHIDAVSIKNLVYRIRKKYAIANIENIKGFGYKMLDYSDD